MNIYQIENRKIDKKKVIGLYFIVMFVGFISPMTFSIIIYGFENSEFIKVYHESLYFLGYLVMPFISMSLYSHFISEEYKNRTMSLVVTSIYRKESVILAKFAIATAYFVLIFTITNLISIMIIYAFTNNNTSTQISFTDIALVSVSYLIYFICWGSLTFLISMFVKKAIASVLISFCIYILSKAIELPYYLQEYTFLEGSNVIAGLLDMNSHFFFIIKKSLITIAYILLFVVLTIKAFHLKEEGVSAR